MTIEVDSPKKSTYWILYYFILSWCDIVFCFIFDLPNSNSENSIMISKIVCTFCGIFLVFLLFTYNFTLIALNSFAYILTTFTFLDVHIFSVEITVPVPKQLSVSFWNWNPIDHALLLISPRRTFMAPTKRPRDINWYNWIPQCIGRHFHGNCVRL